MRTKITSFGFIIAFLRIFLAPTEEIANFLQASLVIELLHRGEPRASAWFDKEWTGEHDNYTNASAGYIGNPNSGGIEAGWKYMRRDTIGSGGSNFRIGMDIFVPRWTSYVSVLSKKHVAKITDSITGERRFPKLPTITPAWFRSSMLGAFFSVSFMQIGLNARTGIISWLFLRNGTLRSTTFRNDHL